MNTIIAWLKSKNWTAHTVAGILIAGCGIIAADPQVQAFITSNLSAHPAAAAEIVSLAVIVAKYTHSSSPAGTLATARVITASPNAPTSAQVDAASMK